MGSGTAKGQQFLLLLWKNFILQGRRPFATFVELALPLLFAALLVIIRTTVETTTYTNITTWRQFSVNNLPNFKASVVPEGGVWTVAYAPNNDTTVEKIMENFDTFLKHGKSDLEINCPGLGLLQGMAPPDEVEEGSGMGGGPPSFGAPPGGGVRLNPRTAFTMFSRAFGGGNMSRSASSFAAPMFLNNMPPLMQDLVNERADAVGKEGVEYVSDMLVEMGPEKFMKDLSAELLNKTMECVFDQLDPQFRQFYEENKSNMTSADTNGTTSDNSTEGIPGGASPEMLMGTIGGTPKVKVLGFEDEAAFMEYVTNDTNLAVTLGGIIFTKYENTSTPNFQYKIRLHSDPVNVGPGDDSRITGNPDTWRTTQLFPGFTPPGPRDENDRYGGKPGYYKEGFLSLMHAVDMAILATVGDENIVDLADGDFRMKRFPFPPYVEDNFLIAISRLLPLLIMLSFLYTALTIVKSVVHEKETKLKEYLMMTGLPNWLHWLAWFIKYLVFLTISCLFFTILFKIETPYGKVFTYTDGTVLFVFLLCYCAATICFCFMISVFFSKANVAAAAGGVLYAVSYMPYLFIASRYEQMTFAQKSLSSLLSNIAMANGATVLSMYEGKGTGVQWSNIADTVTVDDNFTFLQAMFFLILDAIIYMIIAWYVEGVRPGEYGIPKKWNFPFTKSYWCGPPKKLDVYEAVANGGSSDLLRPSNGINGIEKGDDDSEYFEPEAPDQRHIVQIFDLRKVFNPGPKEKIAVHGLNLTMYEGQITVLLGHNGAGKTTTMSMLTGLFPPTSGRATVLGHDITTDIDLARNSMGLCPQHDILFDELTVDEHLYFFSRLKGLNSEDAKKECEKMAEVLELTDKRNARSCTLSGGMKRKLSVGIALCAGSKFIVLDEPTAGMDPAARRAIWDVIQKYRNQCSILLSTHFMDEADLLGDRIAIMAEGRIRCAGSAVFLKNKFGVGYHVVLNKTPDCQVSKVNDFFQTHVPESRMERTAGAEASFLLPFESSSLFPKLFTELDREMKDLGILSYGASITTLEEVFLCVTEDVTRPVAVASRRLSITSTDENPKVPSSPSFNSTDILQPPDTPNKGAALWFQQFHGLLVKRILHSRRHLKVLIAQLLVPVLFVILAIINAKYAPFLENNKELDLSLWKYGNTTVSYNGSIDVESFLDIYARQFDGMANAVDIDGDLEKYLANEYDEQGGTFNTKNIIAGTLRGDQTPANSTIAWFNAQGWHSSANTLLYADQSYIRWKLNNTDFDLDVSNHPLPRNSSARVQEQLIGSIAGFMIAFNVVLGFSFLAASFSIFIVRERTDRASLLQTLAGVDPFCFWLSGFVWDFINFLIPCLICMIVFAIFGVEEYLHNGQFAIAILLFALYCWAALPLTYLMSLLFTMPTTALVTITIFGDIMGLATIITINVLQIIDDNTRDVANILDWVFLILPQYSIGQGLADLYTNDKMVNVCTTDATMEAICEEFGITFQTNFMAWERYGVGRFVVFMFLEGLLFFAILFAIEYDIEGVFLKLTTSIRKKVTAAITIENEDTVLDDDVSKERDRINDTSTSELKKTDLIFLKNLRKVYAGKKGGGILRITAVDNINLGVPKGECFGLLGINGAGKTTTFKMLTGDVRPTAGTAVVNEHDIISNRKLAQQKMGYCPQFDGLIEQMTGRETLVMYARLRGVKEKYIEQIVEKLAKLLFFEQHIDKECGTYSGGNKRKLSTAIALVGGPPVVLLDEPSTGLDPGARRKLWDTISQICTDKRCVIITSHSMEECEALCTRLAIMVNGQMRCLGGPQHLKNKFGQGYSVEVKLETNASNPEAIKTYMQSNFPGTIIKDEHQGLVAFQVPKTKPTGEDLSLATIFGCMEEAKRDINLRDYSVSQTTLEQVFLSFARRQRETADP